MIGGVAAGGTGAAVGAGIGAIAGLGVISTHGKPTVIPPETLLTFQLQGPLTISTAKSQLAFRPVTQADYNGSLATNRRQRSNVRDEGYPPPPPGTYGYTLTLTIRTITPIMDSIRHLFTSGSDSVHGFTGVFGGTVPRWRSSPCS